ncbi:hypothetical protein RDI58_013338 [Solanum bulbocastanum]|uniref:Uncharacterized protein n=1 Tax=Solanum bulbocastanum TaxID=147425 RepID=A0AAN8YHM5_SOLBU
MLSCNKPIY